MAEGDSTKACRSIPKSLKLPYRHNFGIEKPRFVGSCVIQPAPVPRGFQDFRALAFGPDLSLESDQSSSETFEMQLQRFASAMVEE